MVKKKPASTSAPFDGHVAGPDPIGADVRRERAARRISAGSVCVACGEADPAVLKGGRSLIEAHHIAGSANDRATAADVCLNCHRRLTNAQRDVGVSLAEDPSRTLLERVVGWVRGLAVFCQHLADRLLDVSHQLERLLAGLDANYPGWRTLQEAR
jgi:hypothetical protein